MLMKNVELMQLLQTLIISTREEKTIQTVQDEIHYLINSWNFVKLKDNDLYYLKSAKIYYIPNPTNFTRLFLGFSARLVVSLNFGAFVVKLSKKNDK
jgi:hypothetical protein